MFRNIITLAVTLAKSKQRLLWLLRANNGCGYQKEPVNENAGAFGDALFLAFDAPPGSLLRGGGPPVQVRLC